MEPQEWLSKILLIGVSVSRYNLVSMLRPTSFVFRSLTTDWLLQDHIQKRYKVPLQGG